MRCRIKRVCISSVVVLLTIITTLSLLYHAGISNPFHHTTIAPSTDSTSHGTGLRQRFPRIFIIGFGKAGTRAMYDSLRLHPNVVGPKREMRYFSKRYSLGLYWYLSQMPEATGSEVVAEKSPDYIHDNDVIRRIKLSALSLGIAVGDLKFIVMLRHPIVRAVSEYIEWQALRFNARKKMLPRFEYVALRLDKFVNSEFIPVNHSVYIHYVNNWLRAFHRDQFCFVNEEQFSVHPHKVMSELEGCLGLTHYISADNFVFDEERKLFCISSTNGSLRCPSRAKGRPHPFIMRSVVDVLMRYYRPFNRQLYSVTGEVYSWDGNYRGINTY